MGRSCVPDLSQNLLDQYSNSEPNTMSTAYRVRVSARLIFHLILSLLLGAFAACDRDGEHTMPLRSEHSPSNGDIDSNKIISEKEAVAIARRAAKDVNLPSDDQISIVFRDGAYIVTWELHKDRPHPSADYAARVTVNAKTGEVIEYLVGS